MRRRLDGLPVVPAHGVVEGAREISHFGGGLYGGTSVGDRYALAFGDYAHVICGDGTSGDDYVLDVRENVADGA